ncbi:hypothetical protein APS56_01565 [Pseudalgibacter alginicilyticus]|uniref:Dihydroorotase n=1 Tax=Pseudalgibacter alginicilyticus TaxID=1736674 RepID=A0A0P0CUA1_9FLAO|nr:hypothetical protein [Pseudalgibacter alginicilyticus]ALJ03916.1 hypothetical protein APS56_01565 [Pseudalgibacter alginicilyticus]
MKKLCLLLLLATSFTFANNSNPQNTPQIGDVLVINAPSNNAYKHVDFPKLNTIVKRGGIATYKGVIGKHVVVKKVNTQNDGSTEVVLESKNKDKFFRFLKTVKADYHKSLESGEISKI